MTNKDALHQFNYADSNNLRLDDLGERTKTTIRRALSAPAREGKLVEALRNSQKVFEEIGYKHKGVWAINDLALAAHDKETK